MPIIALLLLFLGLSACDSGTHYAPVIDINLIETIPAKGTHEVTSGETLYEIAWKYGLDYDYLAKRNNIKPPYTIYLGQVIQLRDGKTQSKIKSKVSAKVALPVTKEPKAKVTKWLWPAKGEVVKSFSAYNKGLDISGTEGEAVLATAAGKVVYSGDGLRSYGNLIILKHNSLFLSAYAHNKVLLVNEGQWVKRGQKIAEMGHTGTIKTSLHFEIRKSGKPIDPLKLLGKNS